MIIAVNTRSFSKEKQSKNFIESAFLQLAKNTPQHQFIFFIDDSFSVGEYSSENLSFIKRKISKSSVTENLWHNYQLNNLLKKHKADILFTTKSLTTVNTKLPQWMVIENGLFFDQSKRKISATLSHLKGIITNAVFSKTKLSQYIDDTEKIKVICHTPEKKIIPISWEEKQIVLNKYADDKEYFLYNVEKCNEEKLILLLKAFSVFKKWQKSNMQLIITAEAFSASFKSNYKNYKHKNDVILLTDIPAADLHKITGAAYAYINPDENTSYTALLQVMQSNIPIITVSNEPIKEICGDVVLYSNPNDHDAIAKSMILLYKDEKRRNELIDKGAALSKQYSYTDVLRSLNDLVF
ncbi:glycosyltransferase [Ferruginibacter lapsinanis]|uniref:glycosyltransferase n=1 Tax=Ferruginibacter lapsinanis TaxID=563172 RepID=UPI001E4BEF45|nr:glycosyltransferase [Ferruginibacter lapsinanis]UEG50500.1 glycosyltransferase [Ferruginibacter lapsinanis]